MSMVKCPECTGTISSEAATCVLCGAPRKQPEIVQVIVTDVDVSFSNLVSLLVKMTFAAIPAAIVIAVVVGFIVLVLGLLGGVTKH